MSVTIVEGKRGADSIDINSDATGIHVSGTAGVVDVQDADPGDQLIIEGLGGNDTISAQALRAGLISLTLDGGAGNDTLTGSQGADTLLGGDGNDTVAGRQGNDVALLGAGNDTFVWNPGDGSDVVEGQDGFDTLKFNGSNASENMDISANGSRVLLHRDVGAVSMDLNGVERLDIAAVGGSDTININDLTGTGVKEVHVDLMESATSPAADNVIVGGTPGNDAFKLTSNSTEAVVSGVAAVTHVTGWDASDTVTASGGTGNDTFDVTGLSVGGPHVALVGGAGDDTAVLNGSKGADVITLAPSADPNVPADTEVQFTSSTGSTGTVTVDGVEQFVVLGGGGDDQITVQNGPNPSLVNFTLDGGAGNDILRGADGADMLIGGSGDDTVIGGRGNDVAMLGSGKDTFVWNPGDGSDAVDGGSGSDILQFNGSNVGEKMTLSANGSHVDLHRDVGNVDMDLTGIETINIAALGGADTISVNDMTGTDVKTVNVDLAESNITSADNVVVGGAPGDDAFKIITNGTEAVVSGLVAETHVTNWDTSDTVTASGGAGNDTFDVTSVSAAGPHVALAGGDGNDEADLFGSKSGDTITVAPGQDPNQPGVNQVQFTSSSGAAGTVSLDGVEQFVVHGQGGDDHIALQNSSNPNFTHFTLDGGAGNDVLQGANGTDLLIGGAGNDTVSGGQGSDVAQLGTGNDTFLWNPGDGSDIIDGGSGSDTLQFNGSNVSENMVIAADGTHVRFARDVGNVALDVTGTEHINVADQSGTDVITVGDLTGTDVKDIHIDLTHVGLTGADTVIMNGTSANDNVVLKGNAADTKVLGLAAQTHLEHGDSDDALHVLGGAGDDNIDASSLLSGGPKLTLDGGDGNDVLIGSAGDDVLLGGAGDDIIIGGGGHDIIDGGSGNNLILNFDASMDKLDMKSVAAGQSFDWVLAHGHDVNGDVMFDFGTEQLTVQHETLAALTPGDFLI